MSETMRCVVVCAGTEVRHSDISTAVDVANARVAVGPVSIVVDATQRHALGSLCADVAVVEAVSSNDKVWCLCPAQLDAYRIYHAMMADDCDTAAVSELVFMGPASRAIEVVRARRLLGQFRHATITLMNCPDTVEGLPSTVAEVYGRWAAGYVHRHRDDILPAVRPEIDAPIWVVIPLFNQGQYVRRAITSVRRESPTAEIVVVNDGSTDRFTNETFESLTGVAKLSQSHQGLAAARNAGIDHCNADYVVPLDADDELYPGFVARAERALNGNPELGYVVGHAHLTGLVELTHLAAGFIPELSVFLHTHGKATAMFRKAALGAVGGYDTDFSAFEDWELQIALHRAGFQTDVMPMPSLHYHRHWDSMSFSLGETDRHDLIRQLMRKHVGMLATDDLQTGLLVLAHMWKTDYEPSVSAYLKKRRIERSHALE